MNEDEAKAVIVAYKRLFRSPIGQLVLHDLAKFCRANESCFHEDARLHAVAEGRREVWLRIANMIEVNIDELFKIKKREPITMYEDDL
jgi:hypothetical protein